eukprot:SAG11_NODE_6235_length_1356_cov_1.007160_1_plen_311_part_10
MSQGWDRAPPPQKGGQRSGGGWDSRPGPARPPDPNRGGRYPSSRPQLPPPGDGRDPNRGGRYPSSRPQDRDFSGGRFGGPPRGGAGAPGYPALGGDRGWDRGGGRDGKGGRDGRPLAGSGRDLHWGDRPVGAVPPRPPLPGGRAPPLPPGRAPPLPRAEVPKDVQRKREYGETDGALDASMKRRRVGWGAPSEAEAAKSDARPPLPATTSGVRVPVVSAQSGSDQPLRLELQGEANPTSAKPSLELELKHGAPTTPAGNVAPEAATVSTPKADILKLVMQVDKEIKSAKEVVVKLQAKRESHKQEYDAQLE